MRPRKRHRSSLNSWIKEKKPKVSTKTMNSYARNLMTKLDVAPCFDVVIRETPFDLVTTLEKHEGIFHRTTKMFVVVHEDGLKVPQYSYEGVFDRGCIGVVSKKDLKIEASGNVEIKMNPGKYFRILGGAFGGDINCAVSYVVTPLFKN